ncbi:dTMP kinase [Akkermansia glycaniphila]|uniref:Thymidylate kinase n=1 Tax=Akkermansia glycaniphila TaxID=1679444 RepID=A0A1C7PGI6_9BACT|nr:dTMP kinase [Akkermansia glycaniphila]OCA03202.1 hypothetical protein AC781_05825 [Akkermansia glycaniphila]SEI01496.1 thymidylate kinase [Akkermansia glycaniphila]
MTVPLSTRGKLLVFEGIDGSGKSTQINLLADYLNAHGIRTLCSFEPTRGPWGMKVRQAAAGNERLDIEEEISCLLQDRREHVHNVIEPALEQGTWVLLDRYYLSMMAYQGASGCNVEEIREMNEEFAPVPDLAFWLDIPVETALLRMAERGLARDAFEEASFLEHCYRIYASMDMPWLVRIPALGDALQTQQQIRQAVAEEYPQIFSRANTAALA